MSATLASRQLPLKNAIYFNVPKGKVTVRCEKDNGHLVLSVTDTGVGMTNATLERVFDPFFTPFETLENVAGLYGVKKGDRRSMELLEAVHLADKAHAYARTLSGGMKRRLLVAKAMVHSPPILVLDEPTAGVDIELRQQLWEYVRELNRRGVTIVLKIGRAHV